MDEKEAKRSFKRQPFFKASFKKTYTKRLNSINSVREIPFYDELNIVKTWKAFQGSSRSYSIEVID